MTPAAVSPMTKLFSVQLVRRVSGASAGRVLHLLHLFLFTREKLVQRQVREKTEFLRCLMLIKTTYTYTYTDV